jgi:CBS domain-containing protein
MTIKDVVDKKGREIVTVTPDDTLATAIQVMTRNFVGSAAVLESGRLVGMITERDALRFFSTLNWSLTETKVSTLMTRDLIVGVMEDSVEVMIATMVENRFRHLPIMEKGNLVAIVSMGDLVKSQLKQVKVENRHLKDYISGKYPA